MRRYSFLYHPPPIAFIKPTVDTKLKKLFEDNLLKLSFYHFYSFLEYAEEDILSFYRFFLFLKYAEEDIFKLLLDNGLIEPFEKILEDHLFSFLLIIDKDRINFLLEKGLQQEAEKALTNLNAKQLGYFIKAHKGAVAYLQEKLNHVLKQKFQNFTLNETLYFLTEIPEKNLKLTMNNKEIEKILVPKIKLLSQLTDKQDDNFESALNYLANKEIEQLEFLFSLGLEEMIKSQFSYFHIVPKNIIFALENNFFDSIFKSHLIHYLLVNIISNFKLKDWQYIFSSNIIFLQKLLSKILSVFTENLFRDEKQEILDFLINKNTEQSIKLAYYIYASTDYIKNTKFLSSDFNNMPIAYHLLQEYNNKPINPLLQYFNYTEYIDSDLSIKIRGPGYISLYKENSKGTIVSITALDHNNGFKHKDNIFYHMQGYDVEDFVYFNNNDNYKLLKKDKQLCVCSQICHNPVEQNLEKIDLVLVRAHGGVFYETHYMLGFEHGISPYRNSSNTMYKPLKLWTRQCLCRRK